MAWIVLVFAGALEAVWAVALSKSEGLTRLAPSAVFLVALSISMLGLGYAMKTLPVGTAYAVWVGIGAALTVVFSMVTGAESASLVKVTLLVVLIGCVIGLKFAE
jgi:quaternary ammonium compound-resistance protein SugE